MTKFTMFACCLAALALAASSALAQNITAAPAGAEMAKLEPIKTVTVGQIGRAHV